MGEDYLEKPYNMKENISETKKLLYNYIPRLLNSCRVMKRMKTSE